jgi:hypothetical protein
MVSIVYFSGSSLSKESGFSIITINIINRLNFVIGMGQVFWEVRLLVYYLNSFNLRRTAQNPLYILHKY